MSSDGSSHAMRLERSCSLVASALSHGRRTGVRLISGPRRSFGTDRNGTLVKVPYPELAPDWTLRTLTCGIALQCSPSKDQFAHYALHALPTRELQALTLVEAEVALGWVESHWPGLHAELRRVLPMIEPNRNPLDGTAMLERALNMARSGDTLPWHPLLGQLPDSDLTRRGLLDSIRRMYGRLPWSANRTLSKSLYTLPVGGQGGIRNPNLPPPSRPEDDDPEIHPDQRAGIPYPEWNLWTRQFLPDHVAVLERRQVLRSTSSKPVTADLRRWFERPTHRAIRNHLEDGADLDVDQYIQYYGDRRSGATTEPRVFRDLLPRTRDVITALLLDGSSSLGIHQGSIFRMELACADALCRAMSLARERHGLFAFSGNTRHRVQVTCLKDFNDAHAIVPSDLGLSVGGYTRLGAPLRHLTNRLLVQPSGRRLLIVIGDGLMSDEGYEGRYAWADVAHALEEARAAGVFVYYIGIGPVRVDPLPDVFGPRQSMRLRRVEELPRVLARVHLELVAA